MEWSERKAKAVTREFISRCLDPNKANRILSLPGNEALFEKEVTSASGVSNEFVLFEREPSLIPQIKKALSQLDVKYSLYNSDVDSYLQALIQQDSSKKFDLIWLDYCGPLTPSRLRIAAKLPGLVTDLGTYAFTFMAGREKTAMMEIIEALGATENSPLGDSDTSSFDCFSPRLEIRIKALLKVIWPGCRKTKITVFSYGDTVPMYVVIFQKSRRVGTDLVPVKRLTLELVNL